MIGDWLETMVDRKGFEAQVYPLSATTFEIAGSDTAAMTALLLRRGREASGFLFGTWRPDSVLPLEMRTRYERGDAVPTVEKLDALLKATSPGADFVIRASGR